jgi:hypothetical protein
MINMGKHFDFKDEQVNQSLSKVLLVMDEFHSFPSDKETYKTLKRIPCRIRLGMSGTPTQKTVDQLHDLYELLLPENCEGMNIFGSDSRQFFLDNIIQPLLGGCRETLQLIQNFFRKTYVWREGPKEVKKRIDVTIYVSLDADEMESYERISNPDNDADDNDDNHGHADITAAGPGASQQTGVGCVMQSRKKFSLFSLKAITDQAKSKSNVRSYKCAPIGFIIIIIIYFYSF